MPLINIARAFMRPWFITMFLIITKNHASIFYPNLDRTNQNFPYLDKS